VGSVNTPGWAWGVVVSGSYAYVADGSSGLQVVDVTDPQAPVIVGSVDTPGYAQGVAVSGSAAYVADGESGLHILPTQCDVASIDDAGTGTPSLSRTFRLSQNYPNPFNPSTTIQYDIPEGNGTRPVKIFVYDVRGHLIRKLVDQEEKPGRYQIHWDGHDYRGQSVSSGIYLYTLIADEERFTKKMTVLK
jgi:hypothetical protein